MNVLGFYSVSYNFLKLRLPQILLLLLVVLLWHLLQIHFRPMPEEQQVRSKDRVQNSELWKRYLLQKKKKKCEKH